MGAKSSNKPLPVPDELKPLLDTLNKDLDYTLNQVLVNKYEGSEAELARHSDNEHDINPCSSIFTLSLGDSATIGFTNKLDKSKTHLLAEDRSMYVMTRSSQDIYSHEIGASISNNIRYSITFRCTHWHYLNSLYAVGDSNFGRIKFGDGRGTIGRCTPGMKDWAAKVEDIVPLKAAPFRNVVTMCGTNNLKSDDCNVEETYRMYKGKLEEIQRLNPRANFFVCPVLPTRDRSINNRIFKFNRLLRSDLTRCTLKVKIVNGLGSFVDNQGLLKINLHDARTESDVLHINDAGYSMLVGHVKAAIFGNKFSSKVHSSKPYSRALSDGLPHPHHR